MNTQPPKRSAPSVEPPRMFGRSYKPPRGRWAGALTMVALALVMVGVLTTIRKEKHRSGPEKPRAVLRPASRPLVVAVGTFAVDIPRPELRWLRYAFSDALSSQLSRIEGIRVIERERIARLEASLRPGEDLGRYAGALGADLVIGGEVWQQEPNVIGATVRALSPVDIFFAEEVSAEAEVFALSALMAGYIAGTPPNNDWSPGLLSSYQDFIESLYEESGSSLARVEGRYTALLQKDPSFAPALYQRAKTRRAIIAAGGGAAFTTAEVLADAAEAYRLSPEDPEIAALFVDLYAAVDPPRALRAARDFLTRDPHHLELRYHLARVLFDYGLLEDTKLQLTKILAADESAGPAWQLLTWIALLQRDPKATFYARHALAIEERWRAEGALSTSSLRGWSRIEGSRVYVALAERESLTETERRTLLDEDAGLYPRGGALLGRYELLLRAMLSGQALEASDAPPFVARLLGQAPATKSEALTTALQLASVAVLSGASPEDQLQRAEALARTADERSLVARWRAVHLLGSADKGEAWLLQDAEPKR